MSLARPKAPVDRVCLARSCQLLLPAEPEERHSVWSPPWVNPKHEPLANGALIQYRLRASERGHQRQGSLLVDAGGDELN